MSDIKKAFVYIVEPNKIMLFSIVSSFVGYSYLGREESSTYVYIMAGMFLLSFMFYVRELIKHPTVSRNAFCFTAIWIIWLTANLVLFVTNNGWDYSFTKYFVFFFVFSLNSLLWGMMFGREYAINLPMMIKYFEPLTLSVAVFSVLYVLLPSSSLLPTIRGAAYQSNSYYAAFAFGLILFYLISGNRHDRFKVFTLPIFKVLYVIFLVLLPLAVISTGGRGGFVLVLVYGIIAIYYLFFSDHSVNPKKIIMTFGALLGFVMLIVILVSAVSGSSNLRNSFSLTISYLDFSTGRIDMTATSNRDIVYSQALGLIKQKPLMGHGIFNSMPKLTTTYSYPHQIFLEFLLQGGVVYASIASVVLLYSFIKLRRLERKDRSSFFMLFLYVYPFTMLMFSGTYLTTSLFWFCISAILTARYNNEDVQGEESSN